MYIATEVVKAAVKKAPALVFPYYYFGQIAEARHVKGTIAPSHRLIMDAMLEMCDEIHRNGFDKILILSGHGGNYQFLPFFAQMLPGINRSYAVYTHFIHDLTEQNLEEIYLATGVDELGAHGGFSETALMMHIRPDLVHLEKVNEEEYKDLERLKKIKDAGIFTGFNWFASFPHHFAGDPTEATKESGKIIFDMLVNKIVNIINTVKADDVSLPLIKEYNSLA
jgi:creatinine amidohydrolase